jgi:regulator of sigma D
MYARILIDNGTIKNRISTTKKQMQRLITNRRTVSVLLGVSTASFLFAASYLNHDRNHQQHHLATHAHWLNYYNVDSSSSSDTPYKTYGVVVPQNPTDKTYRIIPHKSPVIDLQEGGEVLVYACKIREKTVSGKWKTVVRFVIKKQDLALHLSDNGAVKHTMKSIPNLNQSKKDDYINTWHNIVAENVLDDGVVDMIIHKKKDDGASTLFHMNQIKSTITASKELILPHNKEEFIDYLVREGTLEAPSDKLAHDCVRVLKYAKKKDKLVAGKQYKVYESVIRSGDAVTVYGTLSQDKNVLDCSMISEEDDEHFIKHLNRRDHSKLGKSSYVSALLYQLYELVDDVVEYVKK